MYIFGHKNPDTDSVASAIALSDLKNKLGYDAVPCTLGKINKESEYVLNYFNICPPIVLDNVKTQVKDLDYDKVEAITKDRSIFYAYDVMEKNKTRTISIVDENNHILGIATMKDLAMSFIQGDFYKLATNIQNILEVLRGTLLAGSEDATIEGNIFIISLHYNTLKQRDILRENSIVIVGDMYDCILEAIEKKVKIIIITGGRDVPSEYIDLANQYGVSIVSAKDDTYTVSKLINQCNFISTIMNTRNIISFENDDYLEEVREALSTKRYSFYPIMDDNRKYLGTLNRVHVLKPNRKEVILVDHNESFQSVEGLDQAKILEIIDHHKIGNIRTNDPISFRNVPVGSTCTIVYYMFKEKGIKVEPSIAGLLISGILSDTLLLKSPTTTPEDILAVEEINDILKLDIESYALNMFRAATTLENETIHAIFNKDFKEFHQGEFKLGISQVFTLDIENIFSKKAEFLEYMNKIHEDNDYHITLLLITDVLKEGSYILFNTKNKVVLESAFNRDLSEGVFIEGLMSRKKQVLPKVLNELRTLRG